MIVMSCLTQTNDTSIITMTCLSGTNEKVVTVFPRCCRSASSMDDGGMFRTSTVVRLTQRTGSQRARLAQEPV
jgi:hypothetical protein